MKRSKKQKIKSKNRIKTKFKLRKWQRPKMGNDTKKRMKMLT